MRASEWMGWTGAQPVAVACLALLLAGCGGAVYSVAGGGGAAPVTVASAAIWVGAWGDAISNAASSPDNMGGTEQSFRFLVYPTVSGTEERVRFSNKFGTAPVVIGAARLAVGTDGSAAVDATHDAALQFAGQTGTTIAPGQTVVSDPVKISFQFGQVLAVSMYVKGSFGALPQHSSLFMTNYRTPAGSGDRTADAAGTSYTQTLVPWLLVNGIDVYGDYQGTVGLFGSSTTDGFKSNYSSTHVYPDPNVPVAGQHTNRLSDALARRLNAAGYRVGVVNLGVPGDTVTPDITNTQNQVQNANDRVAADLLTLPNLLGVVTYFGAIDLRSSDCKSAPAIESSTMQMVSTIAAAKVPVVLATLPPSAFCTNPAQANFGPVPSPTAPYAGGATPGPENGAETQRKAFNAWVRSTGASLPGVVGVAEFDGALMDPARPNFLLPTYNSGDNYHPNGAGYQAEANAVDLKLVTGH